MQVGAGQTTITVTTDTLNKNAALTAKLDAQNSVVTLWKRSATVWQLFGDLEAV